MKDEEEDENSGNEDNMEQLGESLNTNKPKEESSDSEWLWQVCSFDR